MRSGIVSLVYVVVGVIVASSHHYFAHASTLKPLLSALLAIVCGRCCCSASTSTSSSASAGPARRSLLSQVERSGYSLRGSAIHAVALSAGAEQSDDRFEDENQTVGGRFFGKR